MNQRTVFFYMKYDHNNVGPGIASFLRLSLLPISSQDLS
jgi:hypothetical protein